MSYQAKLRKPATLDHLRKKEPLTKTLEIVLSDAPVEELRTLQAELAEVGTSATENKRRRALLKEIDRAREAVDEETVALKFQAIGRKAYDALLTACPPTTKQKEEAKDREDGVELPYNPETFPPALVAASCIEPQMTTEEVEEVFSAWNNAEVMQLFWTAMEVNTSRRMPNLPNAFGLTPD